MVEEKMKEKKPYDKPTLVHLSEQQYGHGDCIDNGSGVVGVCESDGNTPTLTCDGNGNWAEHGDGCSVDGVLASSCSGGTSS